MLENRDPAKVVFFWLNPWIVLNLKTHIVTILVCGEYNFGVLCKEHCNCTENQMSGKCRAADGKCLCRPGYTGRYCNECKEMCYDLSS